MNPALPIDLRSDTVTRPTAAMREAMARAEVGDDQYGEDPTTNRLQLEMAAMLGKEAALWLPSGTMANQVAVMTLARPGDEVITAREAHAGWHEVGAAAANAGVQIVEVGSGGVFTREMFDAAIKPAGLPVFPTTTVVEIENTHNRAGGVVFPQDEVVRICTLARERGIASFLDGARLWNAAVASGRSEAELAAPFDLVSVAFSKGLGAPGGSLLAGPRDLIQRANRHRRRLGGAMRQVGIFAAAALHGVAHHRAGWPKTMPTHDGWRRAWPPAPPSTSTWPRCRPTSSSSTCCPARRMRPAWWRGRARWACWLRPSAHARCARSRTSMCLHSSAATRPSACCTCCSDVHCAGAASIAGIGEPCTVMRCISRRWPW